MKSRYRFLQQAGCAIALAIGLLGIAASSPQISLASNNTFTVNSVADDPDLSLDGICDVSDVAGEQCTLRAAIQEANFSTASDSIRFSLGVTAATIAPTSKLPNVTRPLIIDGRTQAQATCAQSAAGVHSLQLTLDGSNTDTGHGLYFAANAAGSAVYGLAIVNWTQNGIFALADDMVIQCNHIGVARDGVTAAGNGFRGILFDQADDGLIGGPNPADRNVIGNHVFDGIQLSATSDGNRIVGNYIGTDQTGAVAMPNGNAGIQIANSSNNTIGPGNLISGNMQNGVRIVKGTSTNTADNQIIGNHIGTNRDGSAALANLRNGIDLYNADSTIIGAASDSAYSNLIAGNGWNGVEMSGGTMGTEIGNNFIGTNAAGDAALSNGLHGVRIQSGSGLNLVGTPTLGNLIAFNGRHGVNVVDGSGANRIQNNVIRDQFESGVYIDAAADTQIGGDGVGNVIVRNTAYGIGVTNAASNRTQIQGNYIGVDADSGAAAGNGFSGIFVNAAAMTMIGSDVVGRAGTGDSLGLSNVIGANGQHGIHVAASTALSTTIAGNYIGTDRLISAEIGNDDHGILLESGVSNSIVGGNVSNWVHNNGDNGITVSGPTTVNNQLRNNSIANNVNLGIDLGNDGVSLNDGNDVDTGPNERLNFPVVTHLIEFTSTVIISGSLDVGSSNTVAIDFYLSDSCDENEHGEGRIPLGSMPMTATNADGELTFSTEVAWSPTGILYVTAVTVDAAGNSSEFSRCIESSIVPLAVTLMDEDSSAEIGGFALINLVAMVLLIATAVWCAGPLPFRKPDDK